MMFPINKLNFLIFFVLFSFYACNSSTKTAQIQKDKKTKPNIIFFMADDLAWADVGFNGVSDGFYETPNMDQLAKEGMVLNRFYPGGPNCAPTRACILSGMYTPRTKIYTPGTKSKGDLNKMRWLVPARGQKKAVKTIDSRSVIDASVTSIAEVMKTGGYKTSRIGKWHIGPDTQGFDESTTDGIAGPNKKFYGDANATQRMTIAAKDFISRNKDNNFFLYFSLWDVHTPLNVRKELKEKYRKKWLNWPDKSKKWSPTYAGMIEAVDISLGAIRKHLKELGLDENTLFVFTSDNGGVGRVTSNLPLRGAKGALFEGGIRTAAVAVWPKHIKKGSSSDFPITGVDLLPTFADIGGASLPQNQPVDGTSIRSLFEKGKAPEERPIFWHFPLYLKGDEGDKGWPAGRVLPVYGSNEMYWRAVPASAIMKGNWKLIHFYEYGKSELYHIGNDPGETQDLVSINPNKKEELHKELMEWVTTTNADIPIEPNPFFGQ